MMEVQDEVSTQFKLLLLAFGVVLVGTLGYFVVRQNGEVNAYDAGTSVIYRANSQTSNN